jgi:hypothetical protein
LETVAAYCFDFIRNQSFGIIPKITNKARPVNVHKKIGVYGEAFVSPLNSGNKSNHSSIDEPQTSANGHEEAVDQVT